MNKVYFFRVGMDTSEGIRTQKYGNKSVILPLGMVFDKEDNDFVYLPLLKYKFNKNQYKNRLKLTSPLKVGNKKIWEYVCNKREISNFAIHYDPCFNFNGEYSYGDFCINRRPWKAEYLKYLCEDDIIIFVETLIEFNSKKDVKNPVEMSELIRLQKEKEKDYVKSLYIIGYFVVDKVIFCDKSFSQKEKRNVKNIFKNNAHIIENEIESLNRNEELILVKGKKSSKLLKKAIHLAYYENNKYKIVKDFIPFIKEQSLNLHFYKLVSLEKNKFDKLINYIHKKGF